jgi:hypothetical protein
LLILPRTKTSFDPGEYFLIYLTQDGDFFTTFNPIPTYGEECGGVIDGNKISMTCPGTFAYGEIKGKTMFVINHNPGDVATCKGEANPVVLDD